jgi:hypothetical protein
VAITQYHERRLTRVLGDANPHEIALRANFEGVYADISAEEKLAIALEALAGTGTDKDTKLLFRRLLDPSETAEFGARIRDWSGHHEGGKKARGRDVHAPQHRDEPVLRQARRRRARRVALRGQGPPRHFVDGFVLDFLRGLCRPRRATRADHRHRRGGS